MDNRIPSLKQRLTGRVLLVVLRTAIVAVVVGNDAWSLEAATNCGPLCCVAGRPQDTIWLVSTRHLGSAPCRPVRPLFVVSRYVCGDGWTCASVEELVASDTSETITTILVHGNRLDRGKAVSRGMAGYRALASQATDETPLRHVIWSWPSDQIPGPLRDARAKAKRTNSEAFYLACLLSQLDPDTRISLIGHSFGVRIATGSLNLLAEGSLSDSVLPSENAVGRMPVRLVALAAAMDSHWLFPGCRHGMALTLVDQMLISYNPCDPVLKRYRWVAESRCQNALGYAGLLCSHRLGEAASRVLQINTAPWIGKTHVLNDHLRSNALVHEMGRVALWE